jgi:GNAT superfamily N-acetyltransferase
VALDRSGAVIGAGIWFDTASPGNADVYQRSLADTCREHLGRFLRYDQLLARHQPDLANSGPAWRLAWLAAAAPRRGTGTGSALLRYRHAAIDTDGRPAVLTANSPRARALFTRHGYRQHGRVYRLPDGSSMWPMLRPPRPAGTDPGDDTPPTRLPPAAPAGHDPGN